MGFLDYLNFNKFSTVLGQQHQLRNSVSAIFPSEYEHDPYHSDGQLKRRKSESKTKAESEAFRNGLFRLKDISKLKLTLQELQNQLKREFEEFLLQNALGVLEKQQQLKDNAPPKISTEPVITKSHFQETPCFDEKIIPASFFQKKIDEKNTSNANFYIEDNSANDFIEDGSKFYNNSTTKEEVFMVLLHYACEQKEEKRFIKIVQDFKEDIFKRDAKLNTVLHLAATNFDNNQIIQVILNACSQNADFVCAENFDKKTALMIAVECKHLNVGSMLFKFYAEQNIQLSYNERFVLLDMNHENTHFQQFYADIIQEGHKNLKNCIQNKFSEEVEIYLNCQQWQNIFRRHSCDTYCPIQLLLIYMPKTTQILFDKCVKDGKEEYLSELLNDYPTNSLVSNYMENIPGANRRRRQEEAPLPQNVRHTSQPTQIVVELKLESVSSHEAYERHIAKQWDEIKYLYILLCLFYLAFVLYISMLTLNIKSERIVAIETTHAPQFWNLTKIFHKFSAAELLFVIIILLHVLLFSYMTYKLLGIKKFFLRILNIVILLLICILILNTYWQGILILNLCSWFVLFSFVKKIPILGAHVLVIKHIFINFVKFVTVLIMFVLPFSISFHVLLDEDDEQESNSAKSNDDAPTERFKPKDDVLAFFNTFVNTLVMMVGELNFKESVAKKESWIATSIFCIFLFLVAVFMMNFLIGVVVTDVSVLLQQAFKRQKHLQEQTVTDLESILPNYCRRIIWDTGKVVRAVWKAFIYIVNFFFNFDWLNLPEDNSETEDSMLKLENKIKLQIQEKHDNLITVFQHSIAAMQNDIQNMAFNIYQLHQQIIPRLPRRRNSFRL